MFSSLTVSANKANELDFFADEPKSTIVPKEAEVKPAPKTAPAFDFAQQGPGLAGFGTGFGLEGVGQLNPKSFATMSSSANKGLDLGSLDFSLSAPKAEPVNAFVKKSSGQEAYGPMDQLFAAQTPPQPATNLNANQTPNINDYSTLQLMFQSNNFGNPQDFNFGQPQQQQQQQQPKQTASQIPQQFVSNQQFQGNS